MKKLLAIILAAILCLGLMAGCGQTTIIVQDGDSGNDATPTPEVTEPAAEETPAESEAPVADDTPLPEGQLKTGLALVSVVSDSSKAASADGDGNAQADVTVGAYTLNADGVITSCYLDCVQAKIAVTAAGEIATEIGTSYDSKLVLDDAYNMRGASPIGAEWDEQAWFFANYVTGKTPAEVAGIALDESTHPTDADITTGCTMAIGAFIAVIK